MHGWRSWPHGTYENTREISAAADHDRRHCPLHQHPSYCRCCYSTSHAPGLGVHPPAHGDLHALAERPEQRSQRTLVLERPTCPRNASVTEAPYRRWSKPLVTGGHGASTTIVNHDSQSRDRVAQPRHRFTHRRRAHAACSRCPHSRAHRGQLRCPASLSASLVLVPTRERWLLPAPPPLRSAPRARPRQRPGRRRRRPRQRRGASTTVVCCVSRSRASLFSSTGKHTRESQSKRPRS
jgi:hypothetical protein